MLYFTPDTSQKEKVQNERMELFIGEECSRFMSYNRLVSDSLLSGFEKKGTPFQVIINSRSAFPKIKFQPIVYKNFPENQITVIDRLGGSKYQYNEVYGEFNWQIKSDTLTVAGYKCQLATCCYAGRNYEAWFTNEIPISEGPYKFHGLPGLIIRIYDSKMEYDFDLIEVKKLKGEYAITFQAKKYPTTTLGKFMEMKKAYVESLFDRGGESQAQFPNEEMRVRLKKRALQKISNPIELEY